MKVICAGYPKTGTKSLAEALRILGYKVYDYDDQFFELGELWDKFYDGTVTDEEIRQSLNDVDALIDGSVVAFWEEIHKVFPEAKIILMIRDEDSWYESFKAMHDAVPISLYCTFILASFIPQGFRFNRRIGQLIRFCFGIDGPLTLHPSDNPRLHKLKFRKHNSYVMDRAPKDKLLVHRSKDGWGPICEFLSKKVPDLDYPRKNTRGMIPILADSKRNPKLNKLFMQAQILLVVIVALFAYFIYALTKSAVLGS